MERNHLNEALLESCSMMEVLMEWRHWTKTSMWMRKQQEMAALLAQAGAQLVRASANEVHRGRTENNSRTVIQRAALRVLSLMWCATAAKAFAAWSRTILQLRQQQHMQ